MKKKVKTFRQNIGIFQQQNQTLIQDYYTTNIHKIKCQIEETINSIKHQGIKLNRIDVANKPNNEIKSIIFKKVTFKFNRCQTNWKKLKKELNETRKVDSKYFKS